MRRTKTYTKVATAKNMESVFQFAIDMCSPMIATAHTDMIIIIAAQWKYRKERH